jgi:trehalose 6-phosphate phosphatase
LSRIRTENSLPNSTTLWDFFHRLRAAPDSALLLDYDGTLAPFQIDRNNAYPYPEVVPLLRSILKRASSRIVIVTGRPVADLKPFLQPLNNLEIWGAHGLERLLPDGSYQQAHTASSTLELLSRAKELVIESNLTPLAEFKPGGIAIHWRGMAEREAKEVEVRLREAWTGLARNGDLKLLSFESGVELRVARPDKGDAVASIIGESSPLTEIAYLGDDLTDEDSFRALNGRGLTVLVRPEYRHTAAQVWLKPPQELVGFLEQWLNGIPKPDHLTTTS